jgi:hypothetical protein
MYTGNTPSEEVVLRLMARKSFSLGLWIEDKNGKPLDITGCQIGIVARKRVGSTVIDDSENLITNYLADISAGTLGYAVFSWQATDLDWKPGEYEYAVTLLDQGYSSVILKGPIQLEQNTEFGSLGSTYDPAAPPTSLRVVLRDSKNITVQVGPTLAPGQALFTTDDEKKLDEIYAGKLAEGQTLNADMIPDGVEKVMMTIAERNQLANLSLEWDDIQGKPAFGTASLEDVEFFVRTGAGAASDIATGTLHKDRVPWVSALNGIVTTTSAPAGGNPGRITLKYTP